MVDHEAQEPLAAVVSVVEQFFYFSDGFGHDEGSQDMKQDLFVVVHGGDHGSSVAIGVRYQTGLQVKGVVGG